MGKYVDAGERIVTDPVQNAVNDSGCSGGCGEFAWLQYVEAKGVVRLISCAVTYRYAEGRPVTRDA